jgi:hypothetical protein
MNQSRCGRSLLVKLYESLAVNDIVQPSDLIFVMAGRPERKQYGLQLYRAGVAPQLLLSVGRFEVSRMRSLPLPGVEELIALRNSVPPKERHFFFHMEGSCARIEKVRLPIWNTYGEALGLRTFLEVAPARKVMVVSTDVHLGRVAFTFARIFRGMPVKFAYCAVPPHLQSLQRHRWWIRPDERRFVLKEMVKFVAYRILLSMPFRILWRNPEPRSNNR